MITRTPLLKEDATILILRKGNTRKHNHYHIVEGRRNHLPCYTEWRHTLVLLCEARHLPYPSMEWRHDHVSYFGRETSFVDPSMEGRRNHYRTVERNKRCILLWPGCNTHSHTMERKQNNCIPLWNVFRTSSNTFDSPSTPEELRKKKKKKTMNGTQPTSHLVLHFSWTPTWDGI